MRLIHRLAGTWLLASGLLVACGGGGEGNETPGDGAESEAGIPVEAPSGPVDQTLAERGETLFREKGCAGCHTLGGGRLTGPDLADVTERREFGWIYHQITNPDSMMRNDPTARQLVNEYMTPMPNLDVSPDQFRALYEYLRAGSDGAAE